MIYVAVSTIGAFYEKLKGKGVFRFWAWFEQAGRGRNSNFRYWRCKKDGFFICGYILCFCLGVRRGWYVDVVHMVGENPVVTFNLSNAPLFREIMVLIQDCSTIPIPSSASTITFFKASYCPWRISTKMAQSLGVHPLGYCIPNKIGQTYQTAWRSPHFYPVISSALAFMSRKPHSVPGAGVNGFINLSALLISRVSRNDDGPTNLSLPIAK